MRSFLPLKPRGFGHVAAQFTTIVDRLIVNQLIPKVKVAFVVISVCESAVFLTVAKFYF